MLMTTTLDLLGLPQVFQASSEAVATLPSGSDVVVNDLERMAQLVRINERLFADLRALRAQVREALDYLRLPSANRALGLARLDRLQVRRTGTLARIRSHRIEAQTLLARYPES